MNDSDSWPVGLDLRDCTREHVMGGGAPASVFRRVDPASYVLLQGSSIGADEAPPTRPPPRPNLRSPEAVAAYLVELWRFVATARGLWSNGSPAAVAWLRMQRIAPVASVQETIAAIVSAGPPASSTAARKWLDVVRAVQGQVERFTGQAPIAAVPGSLEAAAQATAAAAITETAKRAQAEADRTGQPQDQELARRLAEQAAAMAQDAGATVRNVAASTSAGLAAAADSAAGSVRTVSESVASAIGDIADIPGESLAQVTSVPKAAIGSLEELVKGWIGAVAGVINRTVDAGENVADSAFDTGKWVAVAYGVGAFLVGLVLVGLALGPVLVAGEAASAPPAPRRR